MVVSCHVVYDKCQSDSVESVYLAKEVNLAQKFVIFILYETNAEAKYILEELKKDHYADVVRMYTGDEPSLKKEKYFGSFSIDLVG